MRTAEGFAGRFGAIARLRFLALAIIIMTVLSAAGVRGQALLSDSQAGLPNMDTRAGTISPSAGGVSVKRDLTVNPPKATALTLSPNPVQGGKPVTGTVFLECAAPTGGIAVSLSSTTPTVAAVTITRLVIPAGSQKGAFTISTKAVTTSQRVVIKATASGATASATLLVNR